MTSLWSDVFKVLLGAVISIASSYVLLFVEGKKQIIAKKHDLAIRELGDKLFSPLLNELAQSEIKKKLNRSYNVNVKLITELISENQFLLLFTNETIANRVSAIYEYTTTTTKIDKQNVKTQDELILESIADLKKELEKVYSKYRM